jgi:predicted MFS family arabinose efflux permease
VIGALLGGWVASAWGYAAVPNVAAASVAFGLLLSILVTGKESDR